MYKMKRLFMQLSRKRKTKVHNISPEQKCEIHECLRRQMILFRWAGIFAVEGLGNPTIKGLRFKLSSFYGIYYFASFLGQIVVAILIAYWSYENGNITSLIIVFFHVIALVSMYQMMQLGKAWPILIRRLARIERHLRDIRTHNNTKKHCDSQLWIIGTIWFVEYTLSIVFYCKLINNCNLLEETGKSLLEIYSTYTFSYLFNLTSFAIWKFFIIQFTRIQTIIVCGLTDVIPMAFSLYLISYIRDLNTAISKRNIKDVRYWEKLRLYYTRIETMVGLVNHNLKGIVLVSFTYYLVFISVKLFYLLNFQSVKIRTCSTKVYSTGATTEQILYFLCSFTFLLSRALLMSLLAARVHTEAKKPLLILFDVSTQEDSKEVQRFRLQMMYNPIALTGSLFSITRSTILKFFSTIMTYELVLLQLNENQKDTITVGHLNETLHLP